MSTSRTFKLSKPATGQPIPVATLGYFRSRHKQKLHSLILTEFEKSGINQIELCRRLRKEPAQVSRVLGSPSNLRLDSVSDYLFAISGAEPVYGISYPLQKPAQNFRSSDQIFEGGKSSTDAEKTIDPPSGFEIGRAAA